MFPQRHIRSFVLRAGRTTIAQQRALLANCGPAMALETASQPLDLAADIRTADAQRCLEIGFGAGEVIGSLAED